MDEIHPFTISAPPGEDGAVGFTIKPLGDYTSSILSGLAPGVGARLSPAYGHFTRRRDGADEIWIAGGIGVTPFVAFAGELDETSGEVHFFYCVREKAQAAHLPIFEALAKRNANFHLHLVETGREGRLTADRIEAAVSTPLHDMRAYYCGPAPMREALKAGLSARGLSLTRFSYEEFEIRSGIGFRKLIFWLLGRFRR